MHGRAIGRERLACPCAVEQSQLYGTVHLPIEETLIDRRVISLHPLQCKTRSTKGHTCFTSWVASRCYCHLPPNFHIIKPISNTYLYHSSSL